MRDINTTPPQTSREGRAQTTRTTTVTSVPFDPAEPAYSFPSGAPCLALASAPSHRRSGLCLFKGPVRWVGIVGRNQPSDLSPTFPPLPMIHSLISAPLCPIHLSADHVPSVPTKVPLPLLQRTRIDPTRHHQPAGTVSGGQTKTNNNLHSRQTVDDLDNQQRPYTVPPHPSLRRSGKRDGAIPSPHHHHKDKTTPPEKASPSRVTQSCLSFFSSVAVSPPPCAPRHSVGPHRERTNARHALSPRTPRVQQETRHGSEPRRQPGVLRSVG